MKERILAILAFVIYWAILFLGTLLYHRNLNLLKKIVRFDFSEVGKGDLWDKLHSRRVDRAFIVLFFLKLIGQGYITHQEREIKS